MTQCFLSKLSATVVFAGWLLNMPEMAWAQDDSTPPAVAITSPAPDSTLPGRSLGVVSGTASDDVGVAGVQLAIRRAGDGKYWNGVGGWSDTEVLLPATFDSDTGTWSSTGRMPWLSSGDYALTAKATDGTNVAAASGSVTVADPALAFVNLTSLFPPGTTQIRVAALSWDGSVAVGQALIPGSTVKRAFRWSAAGGVEVLADLAGGTVYTDAKGMSADGEVIVGAASSSPSVATSASNLEATVWTGPNSAAGAGDITRGTSGEVFNSLFYAASADGSVAAGYGTYGGGTRSPVRWTEAGGFQELGDLPGGGFHGEAKGISADGTILAGYSTAPALDLLQGNSRLRAIRWTEAEGMVPLADMTPTFPALLVQNRRSSAHGMSLDGSTIFGYWAEDVEDYNASDATRFHAVVWRGSSIQPLGQLYNGYYDRYSISRSTTGDGRIVVGMAAANMTMSRYEAFIWRDGVGMTSLHGEVAPYWNLQMPGYLHDATAISADGHTVAGVGKSSESASVEFAWILTLPTVLPAVPPPPPPPPPPTAPDGEMLTRTATFKPKITFTESYSESIKTTTEVIEGESFVSREVVGAGSNSATIVASMAGIDLAAVDATTEVIVSLGNFVHFATLGEDLAYVKGKTSASFKLMSFNTLGNEVSVGTVKYAWTKTTLTVTITCSKSPEYPIAFQDFPALLPAAPPNSRSAPFTALIQATVGFGETGGACDDVYVTGKVTGSAKVFGSGDAAETYDLVGATMSGSADFDPPVVAFTAPAANLRTIAETVTLTGTVKDPHPGEKVLVRLNGGAFTEIIPTIEDGATTVPWQLADAALVPGPNLIEAMTTDASGNDSALVSRKVTRVVMTPLAVSHNGSGAVSAKFEPTSSREIGAVYSITATPAKGFVFDGWTGIVADTPKLTFTMVEGLALTAHFIPNPFPAIVGDYRGLITGSDPSALAENGEFTFTPTGTGTFTFKIKLGAAAYSVSGIKLRNNGTAAFTISRGAKLAPLQITLQAGMDPGNGHVSGTIVSTGLNATFSGDRTVIDGEHPVPAGAYTLLFPAVLAEPQGIALGSASLVIGASGSVAVAGRLADNSAFTAGSNISKDGAIPVFAKVGTGTATKTISGVLQFDPVEGAPGGTLHWLQGVNTDTALTVVGSLYTPPAAKKRVLDALDVSNGAATINLSAGGLAAPVVKTATISTASAVTVAASGSLRLTVTILPKLGTFTGSFVPPGLTKAVPISGVFFEDAGAGIGLFAPAAGAPGHIRIEAAGP